MNPKLFIKNLAVCLALNLQSCQSQTQTPAPAESAIEVRSTDSAGRLSVEIKSCHDGDTCQILTQSGLWFNARLAGIDAPEVGRYGDKKGGGQSLGIESRDALLEIVRNRANITVKQLDLDPFNRPIIEIMVGNECANTKLLELGLAERYRGKTKNLDTDRYDAAELAAQKAKRGIWGLKTYISPGAWRKQRPR